MKPLRPILLLALLPWAACGNLLESRERRILVESPGENARLWLDFALRADADVQKLLGRGETTPAGTLHLRIGDYPPSDHPLQLAFAGDELHLQISQRIYAALLARAAAPDRTHPPELPSATWLAAALVARELTVDPSRPGRLTAYYEPIRAGFRMGIFPDVGRLATQPVPVDQPVFFRFYAMHCDLLAATIQAARLPGENPFARILDMEAHGRETATALAFVLQPAFAEGENLQAWYKRAAPLASRRGSRQNRAEIVAERLDELTSVPTLTRELGEMRVARIRLEDLPDRLASHRPDRETVAHIYAQIFELSKDAPWLQRAPLLASMTAIELLGKGNNRAFQRAMRRVREEFDEATRRQLAIEALLDEVEESQIPPGERFNIYFGITERTERDIRALDPGLYDLLAPSGP